MLASKDCCQGVDGVSRGADRAESRAAIRRGWKAYYDSRYEQAGSLFQGLLGSGTDPLEAVWGLSAVMRARGRPAEAAQLIERAQQDHPGEPSLDRELGYVAYEQECFGQAADIFAALVKSDRLGSDPANSDTANIFTDLRWLAASLRMAKKYEQAREILDEAKKIGDDPDLDLERGWLEYVQHHYGDSAAHFRAAGEKDARPEHFVPPLVAALLRLDHVDAAGKAVATMPLTSPIVAARADIQVQQGCPENAIKLLRELGTKLDEDGVTQLVALLHGAERDDDAQQVFEKWLVKRRGESGDAIKFASPSIVATSIELIGRRAGLKPYELQRQVQSTLALYDGPDPVPAVVAASAVSTMRKASKAEAMRIAEEGIAQHPKAFDLRVEAAKTSFSRHDYRKAIEELDLVLDSKDDPECALPCHERALLWRCRSMRRLGQWHELEDYLDKQIRKFDQSARLRIELGWLWLARGESRKADEAFQDASRRDQSSQQALFGRVFALREMQRWREASAVLKAWRAQWPNSSRRRLADAMLALDREDFDTAAALFETVPGVPGLLGQASVLIRQRRSADARSKLEEAQEKDRDRPGPKIALATLLADGHEADKYRASQLCEAARGRGAESDAAALACRAQLAQTEGHLRATESFLEEAKERNPYGVHTATLAGVLVGMNRIDEAVDMLNTRLAINPRDSATYYQLYRALKAQGEARAALAALRTAFALASGPGTDALAVALAYELEEQGCSIEAEQVLRTRLSGRNPANDDRLRLGLAWILLSRGEHAQASGPLEDAIAEVNRVLSRPDPAPATEEPEKIKQEALKCRGTAYLKLAEHERNPSERIRLAALARRDQGKLRRTGSEQAPAGSRLAAFLAAGFDTGLRAGTLLAALAFTIVLWFLHNGNQEVWTTTMVMSLTPLLLAIVLLTALLPQLQTLKLAGLEAQTRAKPDVPLPTSPSVALPCVTVFAAAAHENFLDAVDVSDLFGTYSTAQKPLNQAPKPLNQRRTPESNEHRPLNQMHRPRNSRPAPSALPRAS
jgi:tetratricopeptide (TPR) repeat protein